eukprot:CAMPEP_0115035112 /NCGR_PEP_ID=MMETSP0216-20121206/41204_1 /TAXON_ID=223996 /ORGANISM="Protocruzia adherens, Strain Boccale" /LENGTH=151 /DNA_ID=CAMNT_0002414429 /DNA_START=79 /DNA_END=534 /DNA_ORIENTATION=+
MSRFISSFVPYTAVAGAGMINLFFLRRGEAKTGIEVFDDEGNVYGKSQKAGAMAVKQTCISRALLPIAPCLFPPWMVMALKAMGRFPTTRFGGVMFESISCVICLSLGISASIAAFPQTGRVDVKYLEEEFRDIVDKDGNKLANLCYNKGV